MIIDKENIYVQTIIFGLIWAVVCFLFYNVAKDNDNNNKKDDKKRQKKDNELDLRSKRIIIPEKYQSIGYPIVSFIFSSSVFLSLKILSEESGYGYQALIPSIQLMLLIHYICFALYWITLFNNQNQKAYFLSSLLFVTVLFIYFAIININEANVEADIKLKEISKRPKILIIISILINFYLCVISMIKTVAERKKGFLSYFGEFLLKIFNIKNPNQNCPINNNNNNNIKEIKRN